jgi:tripartite-type tricarboxylate transporter receptor subunit TctC
MVRVLMMARVSICSLFCLFLLMLVTLTPLEIESSWAANYPTKQITIIIGVAPGSSPDLIPRLMAPKLSKKLGVPVVCVNKPGGNSQPAILEMMASAPDGYTLMGNDPGSSSIHLALLENLPYNVLDRTFIVRAVKTPFFLYVNPERNWKTMDDIAQTIRKDPTSVRWISVGAASMPDVLISLHKAELTKRGVDWSKTRTVAFPSNGPATIALAGGNVDIGYSTPSTLQSLVTAGKARLIAVADKVRYKGYPDVPTIEEQGYPPMSLLFWIGFVGPTGLPESAVKTFSEAVKSILNDPELLASLDKMGAVPSFLAGEDFKKFVIEEANLIKSTMKR